MSFTSPADPAGVGQMMQMLLLKGLFDPNIKRPQTAQASDPLALMMQPQPQQGTMEMDPMNPLSPMNNPQSIPMYARESTAVPMPGGPTTNRMNNPMANTISQMLMRQFGGK
jgi:hypothetical protein